MKYANYVFWFLIIGLVVSIVLYAIDPIENSTPTEPETDVWKAIAKIEEKVNQLGKTFDFYLDPNDAVYQLPVGTNVVSVGTLRDYYNKNHKVWGQGNPPDNWCEYFGKDNMARLNYIQTNTLNKQGQLIAELTERIRRLEAVGTKYE